MKLSPYLFNLATFQKKGLFLRHLLKSEFLPPKTFQLLLHDQVGEVWRQTRAFQSKASCRLTWKSKQELKILRHSRKRQKDLAILKVMYSGVRSDFTIRIIYM